MGQSTPNLLTDESRFLARIERRIRMLVHSLGNAGTSQQYSLGASATKTIPAGTVGLISFQVITGTLTVSMDGGATSIAYPSGISINHMPATTTFTFAMSSGVSDLALIQTISN